MEPCGSEKYAGVYMGLWNGARTVANGGLLYNQLLDDAMTHGVRGGTVWRVIAGGNQHRGFRSIESEVASNALPVWLQFTDQLAPISKWLPRARELVGGNGVLMCDVHVRYHGGHGPEDDVSPARALTKGEQAVEFDSTQTGANGLQVVIYTFEKNKVHGQLLYQAVAEYFRQRDILWMATMRGLSAYRDERSLPKAGWFHKENPPIMMVVADKADKLSVHLDGLVQLVGTQGVVVSSAVRWLHP